MTTPYACPFNYVGGKSKLLPTLIPLLSNTQDKLFVDLFGGGFSVGLNVDNKSVWYNDINTDLVNLLRLIQDSSFTSFEKNLCQLIKNYGLSKTNKHGYLQLRNDFNSTRDPILFCLLIFYSFNHQIRYNHSLQFNTPFGANRSSYNTRTQKNLETFFSIIHSKKVSFSSQDFRGIEVPKDSIVYIDPPYLITTGSYNDGNRGVSSWNERSEEELYEYIDRLHTKGVSFVLSNMLKKANVTNGLLSQWMHKYNSFTVTSEYKNYQRSHYETEEIVVTNLSVKITS